MKDVTTIPHINAGRSRERGVSMVELLIVVAMIAVVTGFAVVQIAGAQRAMRVTNSAREFMGWLEKARLDSLRRHPLTNAEMANVQITSANSYTVTIDQDGDGALDSARTISIPGPDGATFSGITVPLTIRYNWRGRPVDTAGNPLSLAFSLQDAGGTVTPVPINVTSTGDASVGNSVSVGNVSVGAVSGTANIKSKTTIP